MKRSLLAFAAIVMLLPRAAQAATLLTVSGGGTVSTNSFPTMTACDDAASVILTGKTVTAEKKAEADLYAAQKASDDAWNASHPPRPPKGDFEIQMVNECKKDGAISFGGTGVTVQITEDCKVRDINPATDMSGWSAAYSPSQGEWISATFAGEMVVHEAGDIKTAKCLP